MDVIATKSLYANRLFTWASILAHNMSRELQMRVTKPNRRTTPRRAARWIFESLGSVRHRVIRTAGRFTSPQGKLTLTLHTGPSDQADIQRFTDSVRKAS